MAQNSYLVFIAERDCQLVIDHDINSPDTLREAIFKEELDDANYDKIPDDLHSYSIEANDRRDALMYGLYEAFRDEVKSEGAIWAVISREDKEAFEDERR